ncbi:repeat protein [Moumouvirus goulette]|uniref:Repeat protein n=1 Tax=Moumouvirus goulette TaxID=1247379 RepID=M1NNJ7_9VIRU|nr:repeat protein [Moumouvirus goulette]AGF85635.1 repeat protein [Moumouvirus goulette]
MYYGYINDSKIVESLPLDKVIILPEECPGITDVKNIFNIIYDGFSDKNVTKEGYLLQLNLAETHPKYKMNKLFKDKNFISYENLSDKIWLANYIIIDKIYPLKNLSTFIYLIDLGADYNSMELFNWACCSNYIDLVKYLHLHNIRLEKNLGIPDGLYLASINNHYDMVKYLLENNDYFKFDIASIYYYSCTRNNFEMVKFIHYHFTSNNILPDYNLIKMESNLIWSCLCGYTDLGMSIINFMKMYGENFNIDYELLFEHTCQGGSLKLQKEILKMFNPNQKNLNSGLLLATNNSNIDIIHYLIDLGADLDDPNKCIEKVCSNYAGISNNGNKYETFKFLMKNGIDISYDNNCAIFLASKYKNFDIVKLLLDEGVDPTCHDNYVLRNAVFHNNIEIIKKLIQMEVNPFPYKDFLLNICSQENSFVTLKYLLELGLLPSDHAAIYRSVERNHVDCFKILIQNTCDINYNEILKLSIKKNHLEIVKNLFELNNNIFVGEDILIFAYQNRSFDILHYLVNKSIDYDSLEIIICQTILKNQIILSQDLIMCNNLKNDLILLHFVVNIGNIKLIDFLISNNHDKDYNSWALIYSLNNYEVCQFLLEKFKFDENDIAFAKTCSKILNNLSVHKLLQLYSTDYVIEYPSSRLLKYLNIYDSYDFHDYSSTGGRYIKSAPIFEYNDIILDPYLYKKN